jgi:hypothetical protein
MPKFGSGRTIGLLMILGSMLVLCASPIAFLYAFVSPTFTLAAAIASFGFSILLSLILLVRGIFMFRRGRKVIEELHTIQHQKALLYMLKRTGEVNFVEAAAQFNRSVEYMKTVFCDLVGTKLIRGYFNPRQLTFNQHDPRWLLTRNTCPVCHHDLQILGAGEYTCSICKAKIFI